MRQVNGRGEITKKVPNSWLDNVKNGLANYPLTFYFGVVLFVLSALFLVLTIKFGTNFTFSDFINWLNAHAAILLTLATLILSLVLTTSGIAYKKVAKMSKEDYAIWLQMRSTKTLFPFFTPLHDWLRMRVSIYRWWHTQTYASPVHTIILVAVIIFAFRTVSSNVVVSAGGIGGSGCLYTYNSSEPGTVVERAYAITCDYFTITGSPTAAGTAGTIVVTEYTGSGTINSAYNGTAHFTTTDGQAIIPIDYTFTAGDAGRHTFTNGLTFKTSGNQTITVTDTVKTQITGGQTVTVSPGSAASITLSNLPSSVVSGTAMTAIVTAKDAYSNVATGYTGTVHFTSSDGSATLPANYTFVSGDAGKHTFTNGVTLVTTGSKTVTVTDVGNGSLTSTNTITVTSAQVVGSTPITFTTCADVAGNTAWTNPGNAVATDGTLATNAFTGSGGAVTFDSSASAFGGFTGPVSGSITIGSGSNRILVVAVESAGQINGVTFGGNAMTLLTSAGSAPLIWIYYTLNPASGTSTIVSSAASTFPVDWTATSWSNVNQTTPFGTSASAHGAAGTQPSVAVTSTTGDLVIDGAAQASSGVLTSTQTFRVGTGTTYYGATSSAAGAASVTMGYTGATQAWTILGVPLKPSSTISTADYIECTKLVNPVPSNATITGVAINNYRKSSVLSTITDQNLYLVKGGTIQSGWTNKASATTWPTSLTTASYGGSADMWGGTLTASDVNAAGFGVALKPQATGAATASVDSLTGTIYYTTPATTSFTVTTSPTSTAAGSAISTTVTAKDSGGNTNTAYTGTVHFTSSDAQAVLPADYTFVDGDNGVHTFTNGVTLKTVGSNTVTATDTVTASITGSASITVTPGTAATLTVSPTSTSPVVFDAASSGTGTGTGITISHTIGTDSSRFLTVGVDMSTSSNTVTGVTYNGNALTLVPGSVSTGTYSGTSRTTALYYLLNPDTGTHNIIVSASSGLIEAGATSWSGVSQTNPLGTAATGNTSGLGSSVSATVSSDTNQVVVDVGAAGGVPGISFASTQTSRWVDTTNNVGMSSAAGAASVTMGYTDTYPAPMAISAVPLLPDTSTIVSSVIAGTQFDAVVTAKDAYGNVATSYSGTIHFTSTDGQAVLPSNYTFVAGDNGVHTFTNAVTLKTAGTQTITATDTITSSITGTSPNITVLPGDISAYAFSSTPTTATAGTPFSTTVTAVDPYGNKDTYYTGTVTFTSSDPQAVLPSNYAFVAGDNGSHTFTNGITLKTAGNESITATDTVTGSITATSPTIAVSAGSISSLATSGTPASIAAGTAFSATISAKDAYGNVVSGYTGTIHFTSNDTNALLPANYTFVAGDNGTHTFTNGFTLKTSGSKTVTATDINNGTLTTTATITVTAGAVSQYVFTSTPSSSTAGTAFSGTVNAEDANNNIVSSYTGTVHFTSSDAQGILPANYTFVGGDNGTHTFTNGFTLKTASSQTITATDNNNGAITGTTSVVVSPSTATQFLISTVSSATAGSVFSLTNAAKDTYGNIVTGYTGTVHFTSNDPQATLPIDYTYVSGDAGTHTFTNGINLKTAGSKSVTVTDTVNGLLTATANITVSSSSLDHLTLSLSPTTTVAGTPFSGTVSAKDVYGNNVTTYTGTIHFTGTGGNATVLPGDYTFVGGDGGTHTFSNGFTLFTAFTNTITATEVSPGTLTVSASEVVTPGPATRLHYGLYPHSLSAGSTFNMAIAALDAYGNQATSYLGTVHLTSTDGLAVLPGDYTFTPTDAGIYNYPFNSFALKTAGNQTITATDTVTPSITVTSDNISVAAAGASSLVFESVPASVTAGAAFSGTVTAKDAYGNTATTYTGTVGFTSSDSLAILPTNYTFVSGDNGSHVFSNGFMLKTAGSETVTVTDTIDGSLTNTATFTVNSSSAVTLVVTGTPASVTAGSAFSATVTAKDTYGNTATGYAGTIAFTSTDPQASLSNNYTFVGGDAGAHTFASSESLKTAGIQHITVTDVNSGTITGTSSAIQVNSASASSIVFGSVPASVVEGSIFSPLVTAKDTYGNIATNYSGTVRFTSSDSLATLPTDYTFVSGDAGSHIFTGGFSLRTVGAQTITATDTLNGTLTITANTTVTAGNASGLVISATPSSTTAGLAFSTTITVKDSNGNTATGYTGTVRFTSSDTQAVLPANYTFTGVDAGTHTFSNGLTLKTGGNQSFTVTDTITSSLTQTASVTVYPGSALQLVATTVVSTNAGTPFDITATIKDAYNNTVTSYAGTVHFTSSDGQAILPSDYMFTGADAGTHTFTGGLKLKTAGNQLVTVSEVSPGTLTTTVGITVNPSAATKLVFSSKPSSVTAGTPFSATVTVEDAYNNIVTAYTGTTHFTSSDVQAVLPSDYTFTTNDAGVHIFNSGFTLKTAGSQSVIATDINNVSITGYANIGVTAANATTLSFSSTPSSVTAGVPFSSTLSAKDAYGNIVSGYVGTVHFTSSDTQASLPVNYTFVGADGGTHTFTNGVTLKMVSQQTLTATDAGSGTINGSTTVTVNPGNASQLVISQTPTTISAGGAFSTTVTAKDAYNNVATGYTGTVQFTSSDGSAILPSDYTYISSDNGAHTFNNLILQTAGAQSLTVTDISSGRVGVSFSATVNITVTAGTATSFKFSNIPASTTAGSNFSGVLTATDTYGNTVTGYVGSAHFSSTDTNSTLPADYTFTALDGGTHTFTNQFVMRTSGSRNLTATDTNNSAITDTVSVVVSSSTAVSYVASGPAATTINTPITILLSVKDVYGNNVTSYTGTAHFTSTDSLATLPGDYQFTSGDAGSHGFNGGTAMHTTGNQGVTMTDAVNVGLTATLSLTVSSGVAYQLVFGSTPPTIAAGSPITTSLIVEDINGNRVTSYVGTIHFSSNDPQATLPADYTYTSGDAGVHTFTNGFIFTSVGSKTVTAKDIDPNNSSLTASFTTVTTPGAATQLVFGSVPAISIASTTFSPSLTVKDAYGNVVTNFVDTIHFSSSDSSATLPADYTYTSNDAGIHIFTGLFTLKTPGNQTITAVGATQTDKNATGSAAVSVVAGDAGQLIISQTPSSIAAGSAFSAIVTIHDSNGSVATGYTGTVAFSSNDPQALLPSNYTFTATDAGVHTFTNLITLKSAGLRTLTVKDIANNNLSNTAQIIVNAASAAQLVVSSPLSTLSSSPFTVKITVEDAYGNPITNYANTIGFSSTDLRATLPPLYTFTVSDQGSHTFTNGFVLYSIGRQTITAAEPVSRGSGFSPLSASFVLSVLSNLPSIPPLSQPSVKVTSPANGAVLSGAFTETADASSPDGIKNVQLLVDSNIVANVTSQPYQTSIDSTKLSNGTHVIAAIAQANSGLTANDHVTVTVSNTVIGSPSPTTPPVTSTPSKLPVGVQRAADASSVVSAAVAFASFAPTASVVTTAISTSAVQGISIFNLPFLGLGRRRRRKNWGSVKNSLTGLPISGVFVELWSVARPEMLAKTLTDRSGQFAFLVDKPGQFHLRIDNPLYKTYDSGIITVTDPKTDLVRREVILDPIEKIMQARLQKALRLIRFTEYLYILHWPLLIAGSALSILVLYDKFTIGRLIMVIIYGVMWLSKLFQAKYQRPFGVVVDSATERPQELSIVQLTTKDADSTQVIRSTITDSHGRFLFVVKPDKYNLVAAKAGFRPEEKEIKGDNINMDVRLKWDEKDDQL